MRNTIRKYRCHVRRFSHLEARSCLSFRVRFRRSASTQINNRATVSDREVSPRESRGSLHRIPGGVNRQPGDGFARVDDDDDDDDLKKRDSLSITPRERAFRFYVTLVFAASLLSSPPITVPRK